MAERGWRDPDLPDGVVRFPPEPPPRPPRRLGVAAPLALALLLAAAAWLALTGRLP